MLVKEHRDRVLEVAFHIADGHGDGRHAAPLARLQPGQGGTHHLLGKRDSPLLGHRQLRRQAYVIWREQRDRAPHIAALAPRCIDQELAYRVEGLLIEPQSLDLVEVKAPVKDDLPCAVGIQGQGKDHDKEPGQGNAPGARHHLTPDRDTRSRMAWGGLALVVCSKLATVNAQQQAVQALQDQQDHIGQRDGLVPGQTRQGGHSQGDRRAHRARDRIGQDHGASWRAIVQHNGQRLERVPGDHDRRDGCVEHNVRRNACHDRQRPAQQTQHHLKPAMPACCQGDRPPPQRPAFQTHPPSFGAACTPAPAAFMPKSLYTGTGRTLPLT